MLNDLLALLDKPLLLLLVLTIGGLIGMVVTGAYDRIDREKRRAYWRGRRTTAKVQELRPTAHRTAEISVDQLKTVMDAQFKTKALLNKSEAQVFSALDRLVIARNPHWQVMAQVSLGEFLSSEDADAFRAINSKRVDFALMDTTANVRHTLEYQGSGHHQGTAAARDAVKKEALRKAGVGYHEIIAGHTTPADLKRLVEKLVPCP